MGNITLLLLGRTLKRREHRTVSDACMLCKLGLLLVNHLLILRKCQLFSSAKGFNMVAG